ncbi:OTU domain-containing protein [Aphis craccivora]|uniref:OTU domain-containing protein n=1 Tax=Aphis craccivora TaxID=307492 RepID=A0A6G0YHF0_APHCR|nr:OTU domain-containing protein [Aphis craccivora]
MEPAFSVFFHFIFFCYYLYNTQDKCQEIQNTIVSCVSDNWNNFITMFYNSNGQMVTIFLLLRIMFVKWSILLSTVATDFVVRTRNILY